jgi:hypothetical protein
MAKPRKRDPKHSLRAFRLVGKFLYQWGAIENLIATNIKELLKMSGPEPDVILANVTFRDKVSILSTLITLAYGKLGQTEAKKSRSLFGEILDFNTNYRNILAHYPFQPTNDGIELVRILAKGKFAKPKTIWNSKFFNDRFAEIGNFEKRIEAIIADLKEREGVKRIAKILSSPSAGTSPQGWLGHLFPHHPSNLGSGLSMPILGMSPETPLALRAKPESKKS